MGKAREDNGKVDQLSIKIGNLLTQWESWEE